MDYSCFDVSIENRVAHIVLNRPDKRNAMIPAFWDELPAIVEDIDENSRARSSSHRQARTLAPGWMCPPFQGLTSPAMAMTSVAPHSNTVLASIAP